MNKINYKSPVPILEIIYGSGLFLIGVFTIFDSQFGLVFIVASVYFFQTDGIEIDLIRKKYRKTINIFSLTFGKWKELPEIEYISVFKTTKSSRVWVSSASTKVTNSIVKVNLFYNTNQKIEAYVADDASDAFVVAKQIASALNIDVLDATSRETKWL